MQPILALSASHPGILYLNGSFAGELSADIPLMRPIGGQGAVYLDYRPLSNACRSMARRLVFSGGEPLAESVEANDNLNVIIWPGGTVEIELSPEAHAAESQSFEFAGHRFTLEAHKLLCDGHLLGRLPEGAQLPECRALPEGTALLGRCSGGTYLLTCDPACMHQSGFLQAQQLELENDGRIRAVVAPGDLVGHARLESWRLTPEGLLLLSSEPVWANAAPRWPKTPEETVCAALEAAMAGLDDEAERYLSPALRTKLTPAEMRSMGDLCIRMKYTHPGARPCVGTLKLEGGRLARVIPLYYKASPSGGAQGPWQIDEFSRE